MDDDVSQLASDMTDIDVLCVGPIVLDVLGKSIDEVPEWDRVGTFDTLEYHVGGCASNTAVDLSVLGLKTSVAGCLGRDTAGDFVRRDLGKLNIDLSGLISSSDIATSFTFIMIKSDGRRRFLHHVGSSAHFREEHQTEEGEALRDDDNFSHVSAWEFKGVGENPELHKEHLFFENVSLSQRSYK